MGSGDESQLEVTFMNRRTFLPLAGSAWLAVDGLSLGDDRDDAETESLTSLLDPIRTKHDVPALAAAAVVDRAVKATGAVGVRASGSPEKVTVNDKFHIGSCTKAMTASLVGLLVQQKKLAWDMPLAKALPDLAAKMNSDFRDVPLELLLCNRAGFPGETSPKGKSLSDVRKLPGSTFEQRQAYVKLIVAQEPEVPPGTKFVYSNAGYVTVGAIIEYWTELPWEQAIKKMLFTPLGMKTAGFGPMASKGKRDQPWSHSGEGKRRRPVPPGPGADNPLVIGPAGTVHCSIGDWAKFAAMHLGATFDGKRILTDKTLEKLHTPIGDQPYAMGWLVADRPWGGGKVLNHAGSNTMNYAVAWLAPKKGFASLAATNQGAGPATKACDDAAGALIEKFLQA
jgi:CubicO group peptidase (beta-lactamase class C family)